MKRILIISGEAWREESNGGNVLSNLFEPLKNDFEFAQIYTNPALPNNELCKKYFHLSESEMIKTFFKRTSFGEVRTQIEKQIQEEEFNTQNNFLKKIQSIAPNAIYLAQDLLWRFSKWKTSSLEKFILDYNPDIIFAPMYGGVFLHRLDRYVSQLTGKKIISYVSDDHLTFRHFSLSPFFWINRLILRKNVLETAQYYQLLYTMTDEQLNEYQPVLKIPMKVLKKAKDFKNFPEYQLPSNENPIKIIYGGNLIYNRYKTLSKVAKAIQKINKEKKYFELHIYTQTPLDNKLKNLLHDGEQIVLHGKISKHQLEQKYKESDIVLHVESFDLKQKLLTRLSFSTKIIDLLHTGRTILAICWSESSPYKYLNKNDIAIMVSENDNIEKKLICILQNPEILMDYAQKSWNFGKKNHSSDKIIENFRIDLENAL